MRNIFLTQSSDVFPGLPFRSNARLEFERYMHKLHYPFIIHPHSLFRFYWEGFLCVFIAVYNIVSSMIRVMMAHSQYQRHVVVFTFELIGIIDVILNCITGFVDSKTDRAVLRPRTIVTNYMRTWFVIDFLSCAPIETLTFVIYPECYARISSPEYYDCHVYIDALSFLAVLKICTFCRYLRRITALKLVDNLVIRVLFITFLSINLIILVVDINTQILFVANEALQEHRCEEDIDCTTLGRFLKYLRAATIILLDSVYYESLEGLEMYLRMVFSVLAFFGSIAFVAYSTQAMLSSKTSSDRYSEMEDTLQRFLQRKQLPNPLIKKSLMYFEVLLGRKYYREDEIFRFIPERFKNEIILFQCLPLLRKVSLFNEMPANIFEELAVRMRQEVYLTNDIMFKTGDLTRSMFFIQAGTVALYTDKNVEIRHCSDGTYFGEECLVLPEANFDITAVALEVVEAWRLDMDDFQNVMNEHPDVFNDLRAKLIQVHEASAST